MSFSRFAGWRRVLVAAIPSLVIAACVGEAPTTPVGAVNGAVNGDVAARRTSGTTVARIAITPTSASGSLGQSAQFTATAYDAYGRAVTAPVTWTSTDSTIVAVSASGFATGIGVGSAYIVATSGSVFAKAAVSVSGTAIASITIAPNAASGVVGDTARLAATLRDASGNLLTGRRVLWTSSAPTVVTVDTTGLARAVGGGSATITATSAGISGMMTATIATTTPSAPPAPSIARVAVTPGSASGNVGDAAQFTATAYDANGAQVSGAAISWATSNAAVVTVTSTGYATAVGGGTASLIASASGVSGSAAISVSGTTSTSGTGGTTAPTGPTGTGGTTTSTGTGLFPNAPTSFAAISDQPFDLLGSLGWFLSSGVSTIGLDATAPASPSSVAQFVYPAGMAGGSAPATIAHGLSSARQMYAGFWFKTNANWQGHNSNVNKLAFIYTGGSGGDAAIMFYGPPGGPYELRTALEFRGADTRFWLPPNVASVPVSMGAWHRVEWLIDYGTSGVANGTIKYWLDGTLVGSYGNVLFPSDALSEFQLSPTWGGMGDVKQQTDVLVVDHVLLKGN